MNYKDKTIEKLEGKVLIEIPDWIYYTGKVEVKYQNPEGEWMITEFYPGNAKPIINQIIDDLHKEIEKELDGMIREGQNVYLNEAATDIKSKLNQLLGEVK